MGGPRLPVFTSLCVFVPNVGGECVFRLWSVFFVCGGGGVECVCSLWGLRVSMFGEGGEEVYIMEIPDEWMMNAETWWHNYHYHYHHHESMPSD